MQGKVGRTKDEVAGCEDGDYKHVNCMGSEPWRKAAMLLGFVYESSKMLLKR